jgi:hypothetical protein
MIRQTLDDTTDSSLVELSTLSAILNLCSA